MNIELRVESWIEFIDRDELRERKRERNEGGNSRSHGVATSRNSDVVIQPRSSKTVHSSNSSLNAGQGQFHSHGNKSSLPVNENSKGNFNSY